MWEFYCEKMGILAMQKRASPLPQQTGAKKTKIVEFRHRRTARSRCEVRSRLLVYIGPESNKRVCVRVYMRACVYTVHTCVYIPMVSRYIHTVQLYKPFERQDDARRWGSFGSWYKPPGFCGGIQRANKISLYARPGGGGGRIIILRHLNVREEYNNVYG